MEDFSRQKIIYREISDTMNACLITETIFVNNKCYLITGEKLFYLLCIFNSKIFNKIILQSANITGGKGYDFLSKVKVPILADDRLEIFEELSKQISITNDFMLIEKIDRQINNLIYQQYEFTDKEIEFIDCQ